MSGRTPGSRPTTRVPPAGGPRSDGGPASGPGPDRKAGAHGGPTACAGAGGGTSPPPLPAVAAALCLLAVAACSSLGLAPRKGAGGGTGTAAAPDTVPGADTVARTDTAARADSAVAARADTVPAAGGDSAASLRDSVMAVLRKRRAAGDTADGGEGRGPKATPAGDRRRTDVEGDGPSGAVRVTDVDSLRALGPVYTPYDVPPLLQTEGLEDLLRATILPVIQRYELEPDEWARFWVLVDRKGRVVDHVLHLTSGHAAFDDAAAAAAERLRYRPAQRGEERVPVWVLVRISLLMG